MTVADSTWLAALSIEKRHWSPDQIEKARKALNVGPHVPLTNAQIGKAIGSLPEWGIEMLQVSSTDARLTVQLPVPVPGHTPRMVPPSANEPREVAPLPEHQPLRSINDLLHGTETVTAFDHHHTRLALGDGGGGVPVSHPGVLRLVATVNQAFLAVADRHPREVAGAMLYKFAWLAGMPGFDVNEWALDNGNHGGPAQLLNHHPIPLGTKRISDVWMIEVSFSHK